ncbi:MAG: multidrug efflux SMR transporter [Ignavibacteria bacterium]|nr:multidrug efflux SMR transporter [Ignavibacteria bacterium]MCC7159227.1 multidrug efflux SMR transporter [Ignavibacteria bacterium]
MSWIYLLIAGVFEICFALSLKYSESFSKPVPTVLFIVFTILSYFFLDKTITYIPLGTAYAVWTGIGAAGIALIGIVFLKEPAEFWRLFFIFTLIGSIVGLKFVTK